MRFRQTSLSFEISEQAEDEITHTAQYEYPSMTKTLGDFKLAIEARNFSDSEIVVMLGENGTATAPAARTTTTAAPSNISARAALSSYGPELLSPLRSVRPEKRQGGQVWCATGRVVHDPNNDGKFGMTRPLVRRDSMLERSRAPGGELYVEPETGTDVTQVLGPNKPMVFQTTLSDLGSYYGPGRRRCFSLRAAF